MDHWLFIWNTGHSVNSCSGSSFPSRVIERMHVLYSLFIADGIWRCEAIRLFEFYTFHFMECNLVVERSQLEKV